MIPAMYSVYKKPEKTPIAIHKNRVQCAAAMGVKVRSFDVIAHRIRCGKNHRKWKIVQCEAGEDKE